MERAAHGPGLGEERGGDARDLVQLLVGQSRYTILMPLKYAVSAIRAAVDCWGQAIVEKSNNLKTGG